ncbi:hypothetical protein LB505_008883 [Fusarium chuoi]|nr:hypothetical protein LB505_008883 [Fusarium chuoi]
MVLEVGPHPAVSGMVKPTLGQQITCVASLQRSRAPWDMLSAALKTLYDAGASINWADYQSNFPGAHTVVDLPAYSWDLKDTSTTGRCGRAILLWSSTMCPSLRALLFIVLLRRVVILRGLILSLRPILLARI